MMPLRAALSNCPSTDWTISPPVEAAFLYRVLSRVFTSRFRALRRAVPRIHFSAALMLGTRRSIAHFQDAAVALVAGRGDTAGGQRRLDRAGRLAAVAAVAETARGRVLAELAKTPSEFGGRHLAEPKLRHAGAIYKEAGRQPVEPCGAGRLLS